MLSFYSPRNTGCQENGEGGAGSHDEPARRQQRYTNRRSGGRATEAVEAGRGRGRGLTLGPPPPFPTTGAGAGAAGKASSDQAGDSPGTSDAPYEADQFDGELVVVVVVIVDVVFLVPGGVRVADVRVRCRHCCREKRL